MSSLTPHVSSHYVTPRLALDGLAQRELTEEVAPIVVAGAVAVAALIALYGSALGVCWVLCRKNGGVKSCNATPGSLTVLCKR